MSRGEVQNVGSTIEDIPPEIITDIMAQVAASSFNDLINSKLSCKIFCQAAEDESVYRQVCLDDLPIASCRPLSKGCLAFLKKCEECKNPEIFYRLAVINYFGERELKSAETCLQIAMNLGHFGSYYLLAIILLLIGQDESINEGINLIGCMTKNENFRTRLKRSRNSLITMLKTMRVRYPDSSRIPKCCKLHITTIGWDGEIEKTNCGACNADNEFAIIGKYLPDWSVWSDM